MIVEIKKPKFCMCYSLHPTDHEVALIIWEFCLTSVFVCRQRESWTNILFVKDYKTVFQVLCLAKLNCTAAHYALSVLIFFFFMSSQSTFSGRFRHFLDVIDPSTLFVTEVCCGADAFHWGFYCIFFVGLGRASSHTSQKRVALFSQPPGKKPQKNRCPVMAGLGL